MTKVKVSDLIWSVVAFVLIAAGALVAIIAIMR
jgi:hypothetical protein